ncbi:hypothetical protein F5Y14DRAFT_396031 [Nemania sp. NC0429]|nr:hypothetical protein F5Y14DRAFT_396031 [Nemania sp. NC0429]
MLFLDILVIALFWVTHPVSCLPSPTGPSYDPLEGKALANLTWTGRLTEDGPNVSLTGRSIADISWQIKHVAPGFVWPEPLAQLRDTQPLPLAKKKRSEHRMLCDEVAGAYANYEDVLDQTAQLQAMPGFCRVAPTPEGEGKPLSCNRLTCAGGSAIFLCNHSNNHDSISTCARVGQYAKEIVEWCYDGTSADVKGQVYDGDYWSVMVHADKC